MIPPVSEIDYGEDLIWRLTGSKITSFGANGAGEIFFTAVKNGSRIEIVIGKDENSEIALYEISKYRKNV